MVGHRGRDRRAPAPLSRRGERLLSDTPPRAPPWLAFAFGIQALGWVAQLVLAVLMVVYASAFPERVGPIALLSFQVAVAVTIVAVFGAAILRPMKGTPAARFAIVHWIVGALAWAPIVVLGFAQAVSRVDAGAWGDAASTVVFSLVLAALPALGIVAGRSERHALVVGAGVVGLLFVLLGAFLFLGVALGMAGISA